MRLEVVMVIDELPTSGAGCLCCQNCGTLPVVEVNGRAIPGSVDGDTLLKCCAACVEALVFGGHHPHSGASA